MRKVVTAFKRSLLGMLVLLQVFFFPAAIIAQETTTTETEGGTESAVTTTPTTDPASTTTTTTTEPATTTTSTEPTQTTSTFTAEPSTKVTGPSSPTGASGDTYVYNESTGLWENDYYTWDPVTKKTAPKTAPTYSYNPETGMWDTTEWIYDAPSGKYVAQVFPVVKLPGDPLIANTGPNSQNNIGVTTNNNSTFDLFFNASISNNINSTATSGNASVLQNTNGGSALTGDASGIVNILNLLQSSWMPSMSFTSNVNGNIVGDLLLNPNQIINSGPDSQNGIVTTGNNNLDVNVDIDGRIINNVNVAATSGDALVSENTNGGNATSGDATALVNIINMINSAITSGDSFLGVININGNLDGDILLPENLVAQIDTTGPNSTNTITQTNNTTTDVTVTDNKTITNNVDLSALSGDADVSQNTTGGSATTGDASTKVNIYNLTGRNIIGDNALLVFVNLQGQWTGLIFDAPAGSNTVLGTGPNSTNTINDTTNTDTNVDIDANSVIENNITASAVSGDAAVTRNTNGGNARTGDAAASANIVNLMGSTLNLDGWFGVLFINVLGSWNGSFGVNTTAGNIPAVVVPGSFAATAAASGGTGGAASSGGPAIQFVPKTGASTNQQQVSTQVLADAVNNAMLASAKTNDKAPQQFTVNASSRKPNWAFTIIGTATAIALLAGEQLVALIRRRF